MEIHYSTYEKEDGWIPLTKEYPKPDTKVRICNINIIDWNLEQMEWETGWVKPYRATGSYVIRWYGFGNSEKRLWSLKKVYSIKSFNSVPTHWKEYKYD